MKIKDLLTKAWKEFQKYVTITKETNKKVHFEVSAFKGVYNKDMSKAPLWFQAFEKKDDDRWKNQETFNNKVVVFMEKQQEFNEKQEKWNSKYEPVLEKLLKHADDIFPDKKKK